MYLQAGGENLENNSKASSRVEEIERVTRIVLNQALDFRNEYQTLLHDSGWATLLDGNRIRSDNNLIESNELLRKTKQIIDRYTELQSKQIDIYREIISTSNLSEFDKVEILKGFDEKIDYWNLQYTNLWNLENSIYSKAEKLVMWLGNNLDAWIWQEEQFKFNNDDDMATFNSYIKSIDNLIIQQQKIMQANFENLDAAMKRLNENI